VTFSVGHVDGGTHAGWRRVVDKKYVPWKCECKIVSGHAEYYPDDGHEGYGVVTRQAKLNPGYFKKCIDCGATRDK
jgi:hypothetical protein